MPGLLTDSAIRIFSHLSTTDVLLQLAQEARLVAKAEGVLVSYLAANQQWNEGMHIPWTAEGPRETSAAVRSAAYAAYRHIHRCGATVAWGRGDATAPFADTLSTFFGPASRVVVGVPIFTRSRIAGCILLVLDEAAACDAEALEGLARCATAAISNGRRLTMAKQAEDRLSVLSEAAHEALWDWTLDTDAMWWSGGIWKILGNGSDLRPVSDWKFQRIHEDDATRVRNSLERAIASVEAQWSDEYRFARADGSWALLEDRAHIIRDGQGRAVRLIGTLRDVTEIRHLEEVRRTNEALRAASVLKDQFISVLSHELRTPLNAIIGFGELLDDGYAGPLTSKQQSYMRHVIKGADSLLKLVNNLLDATRLRAGQFSIRPQPLALRQVVDDVLRVHAPLADEKEVCLRVEFPDDLPQVFGDAERVEQVFANLVNNAIKFSSHGTIRIRAATLPSGEVRCEVSDEGVGIEDSDLPRLFQLFSQIKDSAAPNGTGLGLFISKTLVEAHGGKIGVNSRRNEGSTFWFTLPAFPPEIVVERAS